MKSSIGRPVAAMRWALSAWAVLACGCSFDTLDIRLAVADGGTGALSVDALPNAYNTALCASLFFRCRTDAYVYSISLTRAYLENPAVCAERVARFAYENMDDLVSLIRGGSVRFDGAAARACLDQIAASCVRTDSEVRRACSRAFTGTVAVGGGCWRSEQCADGGWCDHNGTTARTCPGTCRVQVGAGATCTTDRQCSGWGEGRAACVGGRCAVVHAGFLAEEGQRCGDIANPDATVTRTECAEDLGCRLGTCRRALAAGSPCAQSSDVCATGLICWAPPGAKRPSCLPGTNLVHSAVGDACNPMLRLPVCNSTARLACNAMMMRCESFGDGTVGSHCVVDENFSVSTCNPGLRCDMATSTCVARLAVGAACQRDADCLSGECEGGRCLEHVCE